MSRIKRSISHKVKARIDLTLRPDRSGREYYIWGKDNAYPFYLTIAMRDSAAASVAMMERQRYTIGHDWADANKLDKGKIVATADGVINLYDFYVDLCNESAFYEGSFAIRIKRNGLGEPKDYIPTPLGLYRKSRNERMYCYSPYFMRPDEWTINENVLEIPEYDHELSPVEAIKKFDLTNPDNKYWGELMVVHTYKPLNEVYQYPSYGGGIEIMQAAALTQKAIKKRATSSFFPSVILSIVGNIDDQNQGLIAKDGNAAKDAGPSEAQKLQGQLSAMMTPDNPTTAMVVAGRNKDSMPVPTLLDTDKLLDNMDVIQKGMDESVYRALGVPPVLCGVSTPGQLGSNQELANNERLFNARCKLYRQPVIEVIELLFGVKIEVVDIQGFRYLEPEAMKYMSNDEIREHFGLPPAQTNTIAEKLNTISPLIAEKIVSIMTPDELRTIVGLPPANQPTQDATAE